MPQIGGGVNKTAETQENSLIDNSIVACYYNYVKIRLFLTIL